MSKLEFTKTLVKKAGQNILSMMNEQLEIDTKDHATDFVTSADKETEMFLVSAIQKEYNNQSFLTEENTAPSTESDELWIIDPIDGTANFIYQKNVFAISIAYYEKKKPVFGIVYDVIRDRMFVGVSGEGAYLNDVRITIKDKTQGLENSIYHADLESLSMLKIEATSLNAVLGKHRYLGSAALEICMLANNEAHGYMVKSAKVWDVAAAVIVLKEAGGYFIFGGLDDEVYFTDETGYFIASANKRIHEDTKNIISWDALNTIK